jgi:hypothetical protein
MIGGLRSRSVARDRRTPANSHHRLERDVPVARISWTQLPAAVRAEARRWADNAADGVWDADEIAAEADKWATYFA